MINNIESIPQTLLSFGKESFAKYHITGNDKIVNGIMLKSLNKISIAQTKRCK